MKAKRIRVVRKNNTASEKKPATQYDPDDIDIVVRMVNGAARQKEAERQERANRDRIRELTRRERDVARRERTIWRKEAEYHSMHRLFCIVLDAAVIGFAILGMATTFWYWRLM